MGRGKPRTSVRISNDEEYISGYLARGRKHGSDVREAERLHDCF
jgi:hypothetical protein